MSGSLDRRIARLEGKLSPSKVSEDMCLIVEIVLGSERANQFRKSGYNNLSADERDTLIAAIEATLTESVSMGEQIGLAS